MSFHDSLLDLRGGCRCQDPGAAPPCSNCTNEATDDEIEEIYENALFRLYSQLAGKPDNFLERMAYHAIRKDARV